MFFPNRCRLCNVQLSSRTTYDELITLYCLNDHYTIWVTQESVMEYWSVSNITMIFIKNKNKDFVAVINNNDNEESEFKSNKDSKSYTDFNRANKVLNKILLLK